ncbi:Aspirochlorine biosynthesis Q [Hyphodiscus hymeniophilus]|uniref:Aspirochlorine biosynthesis Q n=1 Tax=Hyphodiscus hymeniophilus TaxID=353542 RepID=A0A9P6VIR4_9HELO|nr:Aspirochlorine biosynthesis Q [Hyphodiscus hymeniophilus]
MAGEAFELSSTIRFNGTATEVLLDVTHFNYPWILLLIFIVSFVTNSVLTAEPSSETIEAVVTGPGGKPLPRSAKKSKEAKEKTKLKDFSLGRKLLFIWLSAGVITSFVANATNIIVHALTKRENGWWCGEATAIYVCASAFFYSILLISLVDTSPSPTIAHQLTWVVALIGELLLLGSTIALYTSPHDINSLRKGNAKLHEMTQWEVLEITIDIIRVILILFLVAFYIIFSLERSYKNGGWSYRNSKQLDETAPLLLNGRANGNGHVHGHGAIENGATLEPTSEDLEHGTPRETPAANLNPRGAPEDEQTVRDDTNGHATGGRKSLDEVPAFYKPTTAPNRTWWEYLKGYSLFFPYLWPSNSVRLQLIVVACFFLVLLQRAVNIAVPLQIGKVTDELSPKDGVSKGMPWLSISLLIAFKFLQGNSGILGAARSVLWIPISQYSYQALTTASFEHVHSLSLDFHLGKRTGEVLSALSKGNSINNFLEQITFSVLPMLFDLGVAIIYFGIFFDAYYALVVSIITFSYLYLTIRMARWRSEQRRQMTNLSREEDAVKNDSLTSYETVKYFNAEDYEFNRYRTAVSTFQKMEYKVTVSLNVLNISQNMVFMTGLLATSFIAAYQVTIGKRKVGDFVILLTYMAQLQSPLNFFGSFYRSVQSAMISGERLLELFKEQPTVTDDPSAAPMLACEGAIRFQDVKFSYDTRKPALESLSFNCRPGTTTAFVGESGGGKSTVFRLLFRFYNAQDGSIQVDGKDVKDITIDSLRSHIGVVPQDTILFNETLMYNLRYANQDATDEDIFNACRAASIHDKIMAFPDGYNTKVGERGLRLSGGEKQRVAIARTIIKNPRIIMLDEATAALDSDTEQNIQEALMTLSHGRTMLVIAHRLSTVTSADQILVLHAGMVAEAGTHHELLAMKGRYANMWKKQIRAERAFEAASKMVEKANALQKAAMERPGSSGNDEGASGDVSENETDNRSSTTLAPSLSTKAVVRAPEGIRLETSGMEDSISLEDNKSADNDGNPDAAPDDKTEVGEGEPIPAEADNSKTHDHS